MRKKILAVGETYHLFTRSIADFVIFNNDNDFDRMQQLIKYYSIDNKIKFSDFIAYRNVQKNGFNNTLNAISKNKEKLVQVIAYCLMPTHIHLILRQLTDKGISKYMSDFLNSYTKYFNTLHKRKGPLWESRFKNVLVETDNQLLHLTRYIHLNPVTAELVNKPKNWLFSSYGEYIDNVRDSVVICHFEDVLEVRPSSYRRFVDDQIGYQKELAKIKRLLLD